MKKNTQIILTIITIILVVLATTALLEIPWITKLVVRQLVVYFVIVLELGFGYLILKDLTK